MKKNVVKLNESDDRLYKLAKAAKKKYPEYGVRITDGRVIIDFPIDVIMYPKDKNLIWWGTNPEKGIKSYAFKQSEFDDIDDKISRRDDNKLMPDGAEEYQ